MSTNGPVYVPALAGMTEEDARAWRRLYGLGEFHPDIDPNAEREPEGNAHGEDAFFAETKSSEIHAKKPVRQRPRLSTSSTRRWLGVDPPKPQWVIPGIVPRGMVTLLTAEGGAGKTMLEQTWCGAAAGGALIFGKQAEKGASAGFFAEDSDGVLHNRHNKICAHYGWNAEQIADRCHIASYFGFDSILWRDSTPTSLLLEIEADLQAIDNLILFTIDNAALVFGGEENSRTEVTQFMAYLNGISDRMNAAIILSTHKSKSTDGSTLRSASGSTAWINSARHVLEITPETPESGPKLTVIKSNAMKPGDEIILCWTDNGVLAPIPAPGELEQQIAHSKIDREIIAAVRSGWAKGRPYSSSPRASDRYLPSMLSRSRGLRMVEVKNAMLTMISNDILVIVPRSKIMGEGLALASDYEAQKLRSMGDDAKESG